MSTKSFQSTFIINKNATKNFVNALQNSKKVSNEVSGPIYELKDKKSINDLMKRFNEKSIDCC